MLEFIERKTSKVISYHPKRELEKVEFRLTKKTKVKQDAAVKLLLLVMHT